MKPRADYRVSAVHDAGGFPVAAHMQTTKGIAMQPARSAGTCASCRNRPAADHMRRADPSTVNSVKATNTLNARQRAFVYEYIKDRNATQAAIRAGYSKRTAKEMGCENLTKPHLRREIDRIDAAQLARIQSKTGIDLEKTLVGLARIAFADPRKLFDKDGSPLPITELDDDTAMAIESVEVVETYQGTGEDRLFTGYIKKYRFSRRGEAQDKLMKHLGGYKADNAEKGEGAANTIGAMLEGMRRSTLPIAHTVPDDHGV